MPDEKALVRHWTLLKLLSARSQGTTVEQMAHEMSVSVKTIRRDLLAFKSIGFPIDEASGERGRKSWMLAVDRSPPLTFKFDEALSLYLARRFLEPLQGTYFWESLQSAMRKIRASLGERALAYVDRTIDKLRAAPTPTVRYAEKAEVIDALMIGLEGRKMIHIVYQSAQATEPASRDVYPLSIVWKNGSLYLIAHAPEHNEVRHYKIDRIDEVEISPVHFEMPDEFDLQQHLAGSFGIYTGTEVIRIAVRFSKNVARYVQEKTWPGQHACKPLPEGGLLLEFELSATAEFKSWILSFGPHAEVLSPQSLRKEVAADLRLTRFLYDDLPQFELESEVKTRKAREKKRIPVGARRPKPQ